MLMRHKKTGGLYRVQMIAVDEETKSPVVVYADTDSGLIWTRPAHEFFDGRFVPHIPKRPRGSRPKEEYVQ